MKKIDFALTAVLLILNGCQHNPFKEADGDILYNIHEDKNGVTIKTGDFIGFVVKEKTQEGLLIYNSNDYGRPSYMYCGESMFTGDFTSGLKLLSEGDSATLKINLDSMVKVGRPKPANSKGKYLVYNVRIAEVVSKGSMSDSLFRVKVNDRMMKKLFRWEKEEPTKIKNYIRLNKLKAFVTPSGLNYHISQMGAGTLPERGDSVDIHYTIKLFSGKIIDSTLPYFNVTQPYSDFHRPDGPLRWSEGIGSRFYPPGFNEGVTMFPVGTKAVLILPSLLAYGPEGAQGVPPYIPLIPEIEILKIIPNGSKKYLN